MIARRQPRLAVPLLVVSCITLADDAGAVPLRELLTGRTARFVSDSAVLSVYHAADGRLGATADGAMSKGDWWLDADGRYCYRLDLDGKARCFVARLEGAVLVLQGKTRTWVVRQMQPGDVDGLLPGASDPPACECRLTGRRRGTR
jgi:hypothetical protein